MKLRPLLRAGLLLALGASLAACDSPIEPGVHAAGIVILNSGGSEAAQVNFDTGAITGQLQVGVGQTATYRVQVIEEDGSRVAVDGTEYSIRNPGVVLALRAGISIQGTDRLVIEAGTTADITSIRFDLYHGGHEEYHVSAVPLRIQ